MTYSRFMNNIEALIFHHFDAELRDLSGGRQLETLKILIEREHQKVKVEVHQLNWLALTKALSTDANGTPLPFDVYFAVDGHSGEMDDSVLVDDTRDGYESVGLLSGEPLPPYSESREKDDSTRKYAGLALQKRSENMECVVQ